MKACISIVALAGVVALGTPALAATDYPKKAIQIVVPFTPGGNTDLIARLIAERLQASFKQPVTVVNRPGGGMNIGSAYVAGSAPDGYTMLLGAPGSFVVNQFIYANLTYDPDTAWAPVSLAARFPNVLVVHPSLGVKSIEELIAKAKAQPGINYAIAGVGATSHLCGALFAEMAGIQAMPIPYKGTSQSLQDLVAGRVPYTIRTGFSDENVIQSRSAFSPGGTHLATAGGPGAAELWNLAPADWARAACTVAGRDLSPAEWREQLPGRRRFAVCG